MKHLSNEDLLEELAAAGESPVTYEHLGRLAAVWKELVARGVDERSLYLGRTKHHPIPGFPNTGDGLTTCPDCHRRVWVNEGASHSCSGFGVREDMAEGIGTVRINPGLRCPRNPEWDAWRAELKRLHGI